MVYMPIVLGLALLFLLKPIFLLKATIKTETLSLRFYNRLVLKQIFEDLIVQKDYDSIIKLLELKTFDFLPAYQDTCAFMKKEDYQGIMEHFYKNRQVEKLELILSPDCVSVMDKSLFGDSLIVHSLRDLPSSILGCRYTNFNFRMRSMRFTYCKIVSYALEKKFTSTIWDNLALYPIHTNPSESILLPEIFDACKFSPEIENELFYYLKPTMLSEHSFEQDTLWLVNSVLPATSSKSLPVCTNYKTIDPKTMYKWNYIIFKTISSLAFYFEACEILKRIPIQSWGLSNSAATIFENVKKIIVFNLIDVNSTVESILNNNQVIFKPLHNVLIMLKQLFTLFIYQRGDLSIQQINSLYRSIYRLFEKFSPKNIQGDWMYNLFYLFWSRHYYSLKVEYVSDSLQVFHKKNPTIYVINDLYKIFFEAASKMNPSYNADFVSPLFEYQIPAAKLNEVYILFPHIISTRFYEIDFNIRFEYFLKDGRTKLSMYNYAYYHGPVSFLSILQPKPNFLQYKIKLIEVLKSTLLALHRDHSIGPIMSYGIYMKAEKDLIRPVDIRDCLEQFFRLILAIKDFRIITKAEYSETDPRPVIIVTPLISSAVASVLGQALSISALLNVKVPFIIDFRQFNSIANRQYLDESLWNTFFTFFNRPDYLKILTADKYCNTFFETISYYFNLFTNWNVSFMRSNDLPYQQQLVIKDFVNICNSNIYKGLIYLFHFSKFTKEEIFGIIFKP